MVLNNLACWLGYPLAKESSHDHLVGLEIGCQKK